MRPLSVQQIVAQIYQIERLQQVQSTAPAMLQRTLEVAEQNVSRVRSEQVKEQEEVREAKSVTEDERKRKAFLRKGSKEGEGKEESEEEKSKIDIFA